MAFAAASKALEGQLRGLDLNVLVWGSGSGGGEHYAKRVKIREELRKHFVEAEVFFSEELQNLPEWELTWHTINGNYGTSPLVTSA